MKKLSPLLIITAASLWGTMGLFTRKLTELGYNPLQLMLARASMTAFCLIVYFFIFDREKLKIKLKDLWLFLLTSLVSVILFNFCYMSAINTGSTGIASTLLYTSPIFVTVISAFLFREKITKLKITALALAFAGCVLVSGIIGSGSTISSKALLFGIASGFTYGMYSIFTKIALKKYSPLTFTAYTFLVSTVLLIPISGKSLVTTTISQEGADMLLILLFALATNVIPYICFTTGLKYMDAGKANITATVEPVVATLLGIFVFDERLTFISGLGVFLVIFSAVILNIPHKAPKQTYQNIKK